MLLRPRNGRPILLPSPFSFAFLHFSLISSDALSFSSVSLSFLSPLSHLFHSLPFPLPIARLSLPYLFAFFQAVTALSLSLSLSLSIYLSLSFAVILTPQAFSNLPSCSPSCSLEDRVYLRPLHLTPSVASSPHPLFPQAFVPSLLSFLSTLIGSFTSLFLSLSLSVVTLQTSLSVIFSFFFPTVLNVYPAVFSETRRREICVFLLRPIFWHGTVAEIFATSRPWLVLRCVPSLVSLPFFPFGLFIRRVIYFDPIFCHLRLHFHFCHPLLYSIRGFLAVFLLRPLRMILADRFESGRSRADLNDSCSEKLVREICWQRSQIRWIYSLVTSLLCFKISLIP